jgi:signal transduction histidine kinase
MGTTRASPARGRVEGLVAAGAATGMAGVAIVASYLAVVHNEPIPFDQDDPGRLATWMILVELVSAAAVTAGAWVVRAHHPHAAAGLAVAAAGVLLPFWAAWSWLPSPVRAGVLAAFPLAAAGISRVALHWGVRRSSTARLGLRSVTLLTLAATLVHLLGYNPFADPGCARVCDDVRPVLDGLLTTRSAVECSAILTIIAIVVAAATIVWTGAPETPRPVLIAVSCCLVTLATSSALRWATWENPSPPAWRLLVGPLAVALVGVTVCVVSVRTIRTRAAVAQLVDRLSSAQADLGPVAGAIRGVHFAVPDGSAWVDSGGREVSDPRGANTVVLSDVDGPLLRLMLADRADPSDVLAGLTPASRLALTNARLTAVARARQSEVQVSQRRIVATADAERRRIERDLHDGAQQRLVGAAFHMRAARHTLDAEGAGRLTRAETQVHAAIAHLRQLAHGIFPNVLADEGLEAAIEELAATSAVPVTCEVQLRDSVGSEVAMAAYAMIAAVLGSVVSPAPGTRASVRVLMDDMVTVRVEVQGTNGAPPLDLTDVGDRIGAAGGRLTLSNDAGGFVAVAVIPCAS